MSTPHLGEFFTTLLSCAIERCDRGDPASLRREVGRLTYLTFGYSDRDWLDQAIFEANLDDHSQGTLLAQLDRELSSASPAWLDRIQLRALILGVIRLVRASWVTRDQLLGEVCHIFSLSPKDLATTDLSNVATLAPHLWKMLHTRAQVRRKAPAIGAHWAPIPREYTPLHVIEHQDTYWRVLVRRSGLTVCLELLYFAHELDDDQFANLPHVKTLTRSLRETVSGWLPVTRQGRVGSWIWLERPAYLDLSLVTQAHQRMTSEQAVLVCLPILRALSALHRTQRVCGVLTPNQVFIDQHCQSMLGDRLRWHPSAAQSLLERWKVEEITYWSPERLTYHPTPTPQSDMWAFGLILYQLLCGDLPWGETETISDLSQAIKSIDYEVMLRRAPISLRAFLSRCLTPDLDQRWSHATQALESLSEVAESVSPLLQGQRLSEQWTVLMEVDGPQRFIEETAIIPAFEPEEYLARFIQVRVDLYDLASPHIDSLTLSPLFPHLTTLHERWWTNHATLQDVENQHANSMESFRVSLTEIAPEFLFEQLTLLSQQKESLEERFKERIRRLKQEKVTLRAEVRQHTLDTLSSLWRQLGLPPDLIPNLSLEAAAHRGAHRSANHQESEGQRPLKEETSQISRKDQSAPDPSGTEYNGDQSASPLNEASTYSTPSEPYQEIDSEPSSIPTSQSGPEPVETPPPSNDRRPDVHNFDDSPGALEAAEAELREQVFSTPPHELLDKLSELGARKREIELSQPASAAPPPEWSMPPNWDEPPMVFSHPPVEGLSPQIEPQELLNAARTVSDQETNEQHAFEPFTTSMLSADHAHSTPSSEDDDHAFEPFRTQALSEDASFDPHMPPQMSASPPPLDSTAHVDEEAPADLIDELIDELQDLEDLEDSEGLERSLSSVSTGDEGQPPPLNEDAHIYEPPSMVFSTPDLPQAGPPTFSAPPLPETAGPPPVIESPPSAPEVVHGYSEELYQYTDDQPQSSDDLLDQLSNELNALSQNATENGAPGYHPPPQSDLDQSLARIAESLSSEAESTSGGDSND